MTLTNKQRIFVDEYLKCWNATEAARRAGYKGNDNTLAVVGHDNIRKPNISAEIQSRLQENAMSADEVISRLADIARGSLEDCFYFVDGLKEPYIDLKKAHDQGKLKNVKKFSRDASGKVTIEMYPADNALVQLGRVHGIFTDKQDVNVDGEIKILVEYADGQDHAA